jgi:hypothetical protein
MSAEPEAAPDVAPAANPLLIEIARVMEPAAKDLESILPKAFTACLEEPDMLKILKALYPGAIPACVDGAYTVTTEPGYLYDEVADGCEVTVLAGDALEGFFHADDFDGCVSYQLEEGRGDGSSYSES